MMSKANPNATPKHVRRCARRPSDACSARNVHGDVHGVRAAVRRSCCNTHFPSQALGQPQLPAKQGPCDTKMANLANRAICEVTILANLAEKSEARQPLTNFCEVSEVIPPLRTHAGACALIRAGDNDLANITGLKITSHNLANLAVSVARLCSEHQPRRLSRARRWPTLATFRGRARSIPSRRRTPRVATRWPTARLPKWHGNGQQRG